MKPLPPIVLSLALIPTLAVGQEQDTAPAFPTPDAYQDVMTDDLVRLTHHAKSKIHPAITDAWGLILNDSGQTIVCVQKGYSQTKAFFLAQNHRGSLENVTTLDNTSVRDSWTAWCEDRPTD